MDFALSDDQVAIRDNLGERVAGEAPPPARSTGEMR